MMKHFLPTVVATFFLAGSVTGCHKEKPLPAMPPMQAQAPALPDAGSHAQPVEVVPPPRKTDTRTATATPPPPLPPPAAKPEKHKKTKPPSQPTVAGNNTAAGQPPVSSPSTATPLTPTTTAAAPHPAEDTPSPIGQLTEGDTSGTAQVKDETEKLIQSIERGLAGLQRPLDSQAQETEKQIKKFIEQARQALAAQDAGGAKTLAVKANLLLTELKK